MSSHQSFQITEEDLANVLSSNSVAASGLQALGLEKLALEELAAALLARLDLTAVEDSALYGDTLQEQTDYACDEITAQLRQMGVLDPLPAPQAQAPKDTP